MEIKKEGTNSYLVKSVMPEEDDLKDESLEYYLSVEYEVIRHNLFQIQSMVPVQLREKDGNKTFLFDITGKRALKIQGKDRRFSYEGCRKIIHSVIGLIEEIENYMLSLYNVEFDPEYIYEGMDGKIEWIYFPKKIKLEGYENEELQAQIESLLSWLLTQIDYEDEKAVRFIYQVYDKVRKLGFSKDLLKKEVVQDFDKKQTEKKGNIEDACLMENNNINRISYEDFFKEDLKVNSQIEDKSGNQNRRKRFYRYLKIPFSILLFLATGLEIFLVYTGFYDGFTQNLIHYCMGGIFLIIALFLGLVQCIRTTRNIKEKNNRKSLETRKSKLPEFKMNDSLIKTEADWEDRVEGTMVLNADTAFVSPMLRDIETGIVYVIKECPFYIGSDAKISQIKIKDKTVSRKHAVIEEYIYNGEFMGYSIRDLDSTNGTWVDENKLVKGEQSVLEEGMKIRLAQKEYEFLMTKSV